MSGRPSSQPTSTEDKTELCAVLWEEPREPRGPNSLQSCVIRCKWFWSNSKCSVMCPRTESCKLVAYTRSQLCSSSTVVYTAPPIFDNTPIFESNFNNLLIVFDTIYPFTWHTTCLYHVPTTYHIHPSTPSTNHPLLPGIFSFQWKQLPFIWVFIWWQWPPPPSTSHDNSLVHYFICTTMMLMNWQLNLCAFFLLVELDKLVQTSLIFL